MFGYSGDLSAAFRRRHFVRQATRLLLVVPTVQCGDTLGQRGGTGR